MNYDKLLSEIFFIDDWHLNKSYLAKYKRHYKKKDKYQNIIEYLENRYNDSDSFKETIYRIRHNCEIRPICKECGKKVDFYGKGNRLFRDFCCTSCSNKNKEVLLKKQEADRLKNNGRLGWNYNTEEKKQHRKETFIKKYGSWENACREIERLHQKGVYEKYGVKNCMQDENVKNKHYNTLKKNNTFNTSKPESQSFKILKEKYPDVQQQYKSESYPFVCDFYIPTLDLYIECNYHWTHGYKPYLGTENDQIRLNKWKDKHTKYYDNAIKTWTIRDTNKRNTAKKNKLNWIEFFTINELKSWIKTKGED